MHLQYGKPTVMSTDSRLRNQFSSALTPPGVLHPAMESLAQERHVGAGAEEDHKMVRGLANFTYEERLFSLEKALGRSLCGLSIYKGDFEKNFSPGPVVTA